MTFKVLQDEAGCASLIFSLINEHLKHHLGHFPEQRLQLRPEVGRCHVSGKAVLFQGVFLH